MVITQPYITFNGNCEEAMNFYKSALGGEITYCSKYKDCPPSEEMPVPDALKEKVMHANLTINEHYQIMCADYCKMPGMPDFVLGTNTAISIIAESEQECHRIYEQLSAGGVVQCPIGEPFWGGLFAMWADKYGVNWYVTFHKR
ncbi:MAG: VOC family protein [Ignavibacteria bacterium]|nr:VOC family protein [Ignavibacteria bacterium]